jgi:hypothetical protein
VSAPSVEALLARLYTDPALRQRFLVDPAAISRDAGLTEAEVAALTRIDRVGLQLAADSYEHKRMAHQERRIGWRERLRRAFYFGSKTSR